MFIFRNIFVLFILVALAEVAVFIKIGEWIGLGWTVVSVFLTATIGITLLRRQGFDVLQRIQSASSVGQIPGVELLEGVLLLIAGALLITPGFLTDIVGFLILFKPTRIVIATRLMAGGIASYLKASSASSFSFYSSNSANHSRYQSGRSQGDSHQSSQHQHQHQHQHQYQEAGISGFNEQMNRRSSADNASNVIEGEFVVKSDQDRATDGRPPPSQD